MEQNPVAIFDAGDMGCGELVMQLRIRLQAIPPEGLLEVIALDPAGPEDIPAWCRMTGHTLKSMNHPRYIIERKRV